MRAALLLLVLALGGCDAFHDETGAVRLRVDGETVRGQTSYATYDARYGVWLQRGALAELHTVSFATTEPLRPGVYDVHSRPPGLDKRGAAPVYVSYVRFAAPAVGTRYYDVPIGRLTVSQVKAGRAEGLFTIQVRDLETRRTFEVAGSFNAAPSSLRGEG